MESLTRRLRNLRPNRRSIVSSDAPPQYEDLFASTEWEQPYVYDDYVYEDYVYEELGADEIRLVELFPGSFEKPLKCRLEHVKLVEAKNGYQALSYAWDNRHDLIQINCSGSLMDISRNLHAALKHIRDRQESLWLWVDALCIQQGDEYERNKQVRRMGDIYSGAAKVLAWLGEETPEVKGALESLPKWLWYEKPAYMDLYTAKVTWHTLTSFEFDENGLSPKSKEYLRFQQRTLPSIVHLFGRSWWRRRWVIQEVLHAREVVLVCGHCHLSWHSLVTRPGIYRKKVDGWSPPTLAKVGRLGVIGPLTIDLASPKRQDDGQTLYLNMRDGMVNARILFELLLAFKRQNHKYLQHLRVLNIFHWAHFFQCTDPRDNWYSLFNIVKEVDRLYSRHLYIDYNETAAAVSTRLSRYFMHTTGGRNPLFHFAFALGVRRQYPGDVLEPVDNYSCSSMPSWACGFLDASISDRWDLYYYLNDLNFSADCKSVDELPWKIWDEDRVLQLKGIICGEITEIVASHLPSEPTGEEISKWARTVWACFSEFPPSGDIKSSLELFYKVTTCNWERSQPSSSSSPPPPVDAAKYWLKHVLQEGFECSRIFGEYEVLRFHNRLSRVQCRKLGITATGHLGWFPQTAEVGDRICVFPGDCMLYTIAPCGWGYHNLIGTCYVEGLMYGRALDMGFSERRINLY